MFSCSVGVFKNGRVEIIANDQGNRITPSYVAFTAEGERLIGDAAKNQLTSNPENTVFDAKRLIGRTWSDSTVQSDVKYFPFKVSFYYALQCSPTKCNNNDLSKVVKIEQYTFIFILIWIHVPLLGY